MGTPDVTELLESAAPHPATPLDMSTIERRGHRRRRRRQLTYAGAACLVVGLLIGSVAAFAGSRGRQTVVAGPRSSETIPVEVGTRTATVDIALLDGTRLRLRVPNVIGRALAGTTFARVELAGSVYVAPDRGWRLDVATGSIGLLVPGGERLPVPPTSAASGATADRAARRLGLQFGRWAVVASGDTLTDADIDLLLNGLAFAQTPDGFPEYRGSLPLYIVDSPDITIRAKNLTVQAFLRDCSARLPRPAPAGDGLSFERVERPGDDGPVTLLCDAGNHVELWLPSLTDEEIGEVAVDVVSVGPTLDAVRSGRNP